MVATMAIGHAVAVKTATDPESDFFVQARDPESATATVVPSLAPVVNVTDSVPMAPDRESVAVPVNDWDADELPAT
jgi:hypothetical protein